jgi:ubiquinone/menaquinone biosynthesis C-methylase UbiE
MSLDRTPVPQPMKDPYVHGYSPRESLRLQDQARTLEELLHHDTCYAEGTTVLEIGCGVGAQTIILGRSSPAANITSMDISPESVRLARARVQSAGMPDIGFSCGDIYRLPIARESVEHVFICFLLEHLREPERALREVHRILRPGGTLTVIEGDHGSAFFYPENACAEEAIRCLVRLQKEKGGDAHIGRRLYPLLTGAGFHSVLVSPRMVYADATRPDLEEGFTRLTFAAMIEGVEKEVMERRMMDRASWEEAITALNRAGDAEGTFCYTFFRATAVK